MGGDATFSGTTYQARVIAYAYVHVLAQMRLGWLGAVDDTPLAVSGEVKGPGDDMRISLESVIRRSKCRPNTGLQVVRTWTKFWIGFGPPPRRPMKRMWCWHLTELQAGPCGYDSRGIWNAFSRDEWTGLGPMRNGLRRRAARHEALAAKVDLPPVQRMQTAQLLHAAGRSAAAVPLGFRAFRDAPGDPQVHRAFIVLTMMSKVPPPTVADVGAETHVRLRNQDGTVREHTIYADPPINPFQGDMDVAAAQLAGLIGHKVGDVIVQNEGTWREQRWKVEAIVPAIQHAVLDAMLHYEDRFPGEPSFVAHFSVGDGTSVKDFAPIIASLHAKKELAKEVFTRYREQTLPLGVVAGVLGSTITDAMSQASIDPAEFGPLLVEWSDREGQHESRAAAVQATEVVLTRSAVHTASTLGLVGRLRDTYTLVAPRSLRDALRREVADAEKLVIEGFKAVASGSTGLTVQDLEPGHPHLKSQLELLRAQVTWLEQSTRIEARPLETIKLPESREQEAREFVGRSSYDAVALTAHRDATMYADDLGLRRFLPKGSPGRSFSSVGLLFALAQRGVLTAEERDGHLLTLVQAHYAFVPPTRELLDLAVRGSAHLPHSIVAEVFALLGGPSMTLAEVAQIAAQVVKLVITRPIQVMAPELAVKLSLEAMARRWPRQLCALALQNAAQSELALLPQGLHIVQRLCSSFRAS